MKSFRWPKIVAAFCYRYEPQWMVEQLLENLSWVDDFAAIDTRDHPDLWVPRAERLRLMQERGRALKADWMLHLDVDERLEDGAEGTLREITTDRYMRYVLRMRELWTPDEYRVDGKWGRKWRRRFYKLDHPGKVKPKRAHINIYHLGTIEPENRIKRVQIHTDHNTWDNRSSGFEYLGDETGLQLQRIPQGRGYSPPYIRYEKNVPGY